MRKPKWIYRLETAVQYNWFDDESQHRTLWFVGMRPSDLVKAYTEDWMVGRVRDGYRLSRYKAIDYAWHGGTKEVLGNYTFSKITSLDREPVDPRKLYRDMENLLNGKVQDTEGKEAQVGVHT